MAQMRSSVYPWQHLAAACGSAALLACESQSADTSDAAVTMHHDEKDAGGAGDAPSHTRPGPDASPEDAGVAVDAVHIDASRGDSSARDGASTWTWQNLNIEGMGYVTGLIVHPDTSLAPNLVYARTDVGGAYRYDASAATWTALLDAFGPSEAYAYGVESIAVDPEVADDVYIATNGSAGTANGQILVSHDRGAHWTDTGPIGATMHSNAAYRGSTGERLAVDPKMPGLLYFASRDNGLWRQSPGGAWTVVSGGLPTATDPGDTFVVFDGSSSTIGGATSRLLVGVYGKGVYESVDAGQTFVLSSTGPTNPTRAAIGSDGGLYVSFGGSEGTHGPGAVERLLGGVWTDITPPTGTAASYSGIAVDPNAPASVMVTTNSARIYRSPDRGASWAAVGLEFQDVPSYVWEATWYVWGSAALVIDPNDTTGQTVWRTDGFAASRTTQVSGGSWTPVMHGLEELVGTALRVPPVAGGAAVLVACDDAMGFAITDPTVTPVHKDDPTETDVAVVTSLDYSAASPSSVVFVGWDEITSDALTGVSTNDGQSFVPFADQTPGRGGVIAVSATNTSNLVWAPTEEAPVVYSVDGGGHWSASTGLPSSSYYRSDAWYTGQSLAADRVDGSRFYYLSSVGGVVQLWTSVDGGATFSSSSTAVLAGAPASTQDPRIKPNPATAGDVWITLGASPGLTSPLYRSADGGASVQSVAGVEQAYLAGFGKGLSASEPALYLLGRTAGAPADAMFRSLDLGVTWHQLSDPSVEGFGLASDIEGDLLADDTVYVALGGRGFMSGRPSPP